MQRNRPGDDAPRNASPGQPRRSAGPSVPRGLAARRVAAYALADVTQEHLPLDEALERQFGIGDGIALDERDRALVRAIVTAALRRLGTIHAALDARMPKGIPAKSGLLPEILIVGAAQILLLDIPDRAAVDLAVHHARADRRAFPYAKLVNAVLRRVAESREAILAETGGDDVPHWLTERWRGTYGAATARAIAGALRHEPGIDITVKADAAGWAQRLDGRLLPNGSVRLNARAHVAALPGYADGEWWVQDAAASLPARLIAATPGERVLDLCAAPGGKTAQLAAAGAVVTAVDRSPERLARLAENMTRLKLDVRTVAADARTLTDEPYDAVLLDAPCSATGTIRRHPDVAWTKQPEEIASLAALQSALLDRAAALVRPGGRLVYSTCSLEPEEGEAQIAAFLARHADFARSPVSPEEIGGIADVIDADGQLRTLPHHLPDETPRLAGLDGFFAARLVRRKA
ncbi:RsmB/NOP family class I SAM-dependent RNA methyltransferase [Pseudochelatococcus lubricantis]|uniref:RsmB/NOP family class I SAM-dependent RNA methyltransferase n=1 Tax=Pseudochelatococcus lubricantis TaxID=1538102 RepID=UPI0035E5E357